MGVRYKDTPWERLRQIGFVLGNEAKFPRKDPCLPTVNTETMTLVLFVCRPIPFLLYSWFSELFPNQSMYIMS